MPFAVKPVRCLDEQTQVNLDRIRATLDPPDFETTRLLVHAIYDLAVELDKAKMQLAQQNTQRSSL